MRLKEKTNNHLYAAFLKQKGGSFPVFKGRLGRTRQGGGFFAFKMLKNLGKTLARALPKIGKGIAREVGPALMDSVMNQSKAVLRGEKKFKQGLKAVVSKQMGQRIIQATRGQVKKQMGRGGLKNGKKRKKVKVIGPKGNDVFSRMKF